jgi:phosphopantetheinyl transferase
MIIAKFPCGIDIEISERDPSKIQHKFLNKEDFTSGENSKNLLKNWCAKEVLYKIKGDNSILFSDHLIVKKNGVIFSGYCNHPKFKFTSNIKIFNFENYCLAFNTNYKELTTC